MSFYATGVIYPETYMQTFKTIHATAQQQKERKKKIKDNSLKQKRKTDLHEKYAIERII